ncbi:response regulator transcription factor [Nocardioides pinisoli]|uniref:Response regulator transcription factor n=1 Tax=Nocardioides pinisoli TaxID=2950279 RepID=A0ABT1L4M6_9ACTN|nr:response regulator transcription factor [Nocardioides pinisoli]MCP3424448.1 response regulator transcription factor [Nocardioides pinisoli]
MSIRVLIADDHAVVRDGLALVLGHLEGFEVVGEAATGHDAVKQAVLLKPDVILMDVQMPELDGVEATRKVTELLPGVAVLMLSMYSDEAAAVGAMAAGARGYLLKGASHADVAAALRAVVAGQAIFGQEVADVLLAQIGTGGVQRPYPFPRLSERERQVLDLLVAGNRTNQIASALFVSSKTVSNQLTSIYHKLGVVDRTEAILLARDKGLPLR